MTKTNLLLGRLDAGGVQLRIQVQCLLEASALHLLGLVLELLMLGPPRLHFRLSAVVMEG